MASLAYALKSFQSGSMSKEELLAEVDRILGQGRVNEAWLLKTLKEENTRIALPQDVHEEVQARIARSAAAKSEQRQGGENIGSEGHRPSDPDDSRTRMATSLFKNGSMSSRTGAVDEWLLDNGRSLTGKAGVVEAEPMKSRGDVLNDRFVLEECIGTGGMSTVYKALDRRKLEADDRNPYVAVKVLNVEFRSHPDSLIALQREAKKSQSLAHPNIVRVYDFDRDGSTVYMTMEYLPGESLAKILRAPGFKGLPEDEGVRILESIARALMFAHENGIIHADFKPANVILTDDGKVKVIDFGIARAFQRPEDTDMEATRFDPGSLGALTPTYASPEMLEHQEPDPRDDVYALACIAYEMLTGRHPFGRMQATEARDGGLELERRKQLSRRQWKALKSALAFDRERRTPSIRQFLTDIGPAGAVSGSKPLYAVGKVALAAVVGVGAYYYFVANSPVVGLGTENAGGRSTEIAGLQVLQEKALTSQKAAPAREAEVVAPLAPSQPGSEETNQVSPGKPERVAALAKQLNAAPEMNRKTQLSSSTVTDLLDKVPCAAFSAVVKTGEVNVKGYVSRQFDVARLESELLALPGARTVNTTLQRFDEEKCPVIELFAPYWNIDREDSYGVSLVTADEGNELVEGEPLIIEVTTPDYESFVNIDYFSLDGGVVHLVPGPRVKANKAPANYKATIGDLGEWIISEPFGSELVTVLLTPRPLFDTLRAEQESRATYLAAVEEELARIAKKSGKNSVAVDFVVIETKPK